MVFSFLICKQELLWLTGREGRDHASLGPEPPVTWVGPWGKGMPPTVGDGSVDVPRGREGRSQKYLFRKAWETWVFQLDGDAGSAVGVMEVAMVGWRIRSCSEATRSLMLPECSFWWLIRALPSPTSSLAPCHPFSRLQQGFACSLEFTQQPWEALRKALGSGMRSRWALLSCPDRKAVEWGC